MKIEHVHHMIFSLFFIVCFFFFFTAHAFSVPGMSVFSVAGRKCCKCTVGRLDALTLLTKPSAMDQDAIRRGGWGLSLTQEQGKGGRCLPAGNLQSRAPCQPPGAWKVQAGSGEATAAALGGSRAQEHTGEFPACFEYVRQVSKLKIFMFSVNSAWNDVSSKESCPLAELSAKEMDQLHKYSR